MRYAHRLARFAVALGYGDANGIARLRIGAIEYVA